MNTLAITLPETPSRTERLKSHLASMNIEAKFIEGIHAKTFGLLTSKTYDYDHPDEGYHIPAKHVGLFLSHYICWNIAALSDDDTLILEDDVLFESDINETYLEAKQVGFDMLFVGSGNTFDKPKTHIRCNLYNVGFPQCTHAYIITPVAAKRLLLEQRECFAPIDLSLILKSFPSMKIITVLPRLVSQYGQTIME